MTARDRSFPNGSPVCDYWLARCEGFAVRAGSRTLGAVEQLDRDPRTARVQMLVLRRRRRTRELDAAKVLAIVPGRRLLLARRTEHVRPAARAVAHAALRTTSATKRFAAVAAPVAAALVKAFAEVAWAYAARAAVELRLASWRLARRVRDHRARGVSPSQQPVGRGRNVGPTRSW